MEKNNFIKQVLDKTLDKKLDTVFSGNIFIFHAFDIGDDLDLARVRESKVLEYYPLTLSKYFKNYHIPLTVKLPADAPAQQCISAKLHNFGVITLRYKIQFKESFEDLRAHINGIEDKYHKQSVKDAEALFRKIKNLVKQPHFYHIRQSYVIVQVDPRADITDTVVLKEKYGSFIASTLRFETETLSEYKKDEILESAIGYYRGDLIIIDTEAAFVYDDEYEETLDLVEFANMQLLELQYFDRLIDNQLNSVYNRQASVLSVKAYLPLIGSLKNDPIEDLGRLRVDISVITERLENSIKLAGETYYTELYGLLIKKLDLKKWKESLNNKLSIVKDIRTIYQNKIDSLREDILSVSVILLILVEVILGLLNYFRD